MEVLYQLSQEGGGGNGSRPARRRPAASAPLLAGAADLPEVDQRRRRELAEAVEPLADPPSAGPLDPARRVVLLSHLLAIDELDARCDNQPSELVVRVAAQAVRGCVLASGVLGPNPVSLR